MVPYPAAFMAAEATFPKAKTEDPIAEDAKALAAGLVPKGTGEILSKIAQNSPSPEAEMLRTSPPEKALGEAGTQGTEDHEVPSGNTGVISCRYHNLPLSSRPNKALLFPLIALSRQPKGG